MQVSTHRLTLLVALITGTLMSSGPAFAAKEKFERTKPHLNVGTIGHQGISILTTNLGSNLDDPTPCTFSGELLAIDHTPDLPAPEELLRAPVALAEGASLSVPIPHPLDPGREGTRRELSVEINPGETADSSCRIAAAVVGYDGDSQATRYASPHQVTRIDRFAMSPVSPESFVGFAGGNADQAAKVVFTRFDASDEERLQGRQCDYSGVLLVQGVPILDSDHNEAGQIHPVEFADSDPVFVEIPFVDLGAKGDVRVDAALWYVAGSGPLAQCANRLDIGVQVVDAESGETHSNQTTRIPAHTPEWTDANVRDPG